MTYTPADPAITKGLAGGYASLGGDSLVLEAQLARPATLNTQTGVAYTLVLSDINRIVGTDNVAANTVTVPPNSSVSFPVGTVITIRQNGAGQTLIAPGAGVSVRSRGSIFRLAGQYAYATLIKVATDTWDLSGDLTA